MWHAAKGGHKELVDFFIQKGANDWNKGMANAAIGGHRILLISLFRKVQREENTMFKCKPR
jgi:hypothetical protein